MEALRYLGILSPRDAREAEADRKMTPALYLKNSRHVCLKVLAGLIDSDGRYTKSNGSFMIVQSERWHAKLCDDIVHMTRSLGFRVRAAKYQLSRPYLLSIRALCLRMTVLNPLQYLPL